MRVIWTMRADLKKSVKTLVLTKINYVLFLTGGTSKSTLATIKGLFHQAIRNSLYAFRTTSIKNILFESGLPSLEDDINDVKLKLIPKIVC